MTETLVYSSRDLMMEIHQKEFQEMPPEDRSDYLAMLIVLFGKDYPQALLQKITERPNGTLQR